MSCRPPSFAAAALSSPLRAALVVGLAALLAAPLAARDDFLRATSRDLTLRERQALEERIDELANPSPQVRSHALHLLANLGRPAAQQLAESLRRGSDPKLLRNACLTLGAMGDVTSLATLEHWLLEENSTEDPTRAALFALARGKAPLTPALADRLRKLMLESPISTIRESALLCAGARKLAGLPELLDKPLQNEKSARVRGCMLVALAESAESAAVPLVARFLDPRKVRDEKLHRAALYAVARLGDKALLEPLLTFKPDEHEVGAYVVALGAFDDARAVDALGRLLTRDPDRAVAAVFSLSHVATPAARDWLERALQDKYGERVRGAAALAVADLTEQERYLAGLRELATAPVGAHGKSEALLALARIGDAESARVVADALPMWNVREKELLERAPLFDRARPAARAAAARVASRRRRGTLPRRRGRAVAARPPARAEGADHRPAHELVGALAAAARRPALARRARPARARQGRLRTDDEARRQRPEHAAAADRRRHTAAESSAERRAAAVRQRWVGRFRRVDVASTVRFRRIGIGRLRIRRFEPGLRWRPVEPARPPVAREARHGALRARPAAVARRLLALRARRPVRHRARPLNRRDRASSRAARAC
jgi:hypothetical protein